MQKQKIQQARVVSNSRLYDGGSTNKWTQTGKQPNKYGNANTDTYTTWKYNNTNTNMNVEVINHMYGKQNKT